MDNGLHAASPRGKNKLNAAESQHIILYCSRYTYHARTHTHTLSFAHPSVYDEKGARIGLSYAYFRRRALPPRAQNATLPFFVYNVVIIIYSCNMYYNGQQRVRYRRAEDTPGAHIIHTPFNRHVNEIVFIQL